MCIEKCGEKSSCKGFRNHSDSKDASGKVLLPVICRWNCLYATVVYIACEMLPLCYGLRRNYISCQLLQVFHILQHHALTRLKKHINWETCSDSFVPRREQSHLHCASVQLIWREPMELPEKDMICFLRLGFRPQLKLTRGNAAELWLRLRSQQPK